MSLARAVPKMSQKSSMTRGGAAVPQCCRNRINVQMAAGASAASMRVLVAAMRWGHEIKRRVHSAARRVGKKPARVFPAAAAVLKKSLGREIECGVFEAQCNPNRNPPGWRPSARSGWRLRSMTRSPSPEQQKLLHRRLAIVAHVPDPRQRPGAHGCGGHESSLEAGLVERHLRLRTEVARPSGTRVVVARASRASGSFTSKSVVRASHSARMKAIERAVVGVQGREIGRVNYASQRPRTQS